MTLRPRVSVIVLSHRFDMIDQAMRSVKAQDYPSDRVEILLKHAEEYYPEKFNEAWRGARGDYLTFLPDDDSLQPDFLAKHVAAMELGHHMAYSDHFITGRLRVKWRMPDFSPLTLRMYAVPWMTFMVRASTFGNMGGWDGHQAYSDWDFGIRLIESRCSVMHLRGQFLWNRLEHRNAGSWLMNTPAHDAALTQLRAKHPHVIVPQARGVDFAENNIEDRRMPPERGVPWRAL